MGRDELKGPRIVCRKAWSLMFHQAAPALLQVSPERQEELPSHRGGFKEERQQRELMPGLQFRPRRVCFNSLRGDVLVPPADVLKGTRRFHTAGHLEGTVDFRAWRFLY